MTVDSVEALWALIREESKPLHRVREGARLDEIENMEQQLGVQLPVDYTEFLKHTDGAILFQIEEMLGTKAGWKYDESLVVAKERLSKQSPPLPPELIPFQRSGTIHCFHVKQEKPETKFSVVEWNPVTGQIMKRYDCFLDWVNRYLIPVGQGTL